MKEALEFAFALMIGILLLGFGGCYIEDCIERRRNTRIAKLESAWKDLRYEREQWRRDHFFDFYHPEYQELWEREIGAEAIYLIFASLKHASHTSYFFYQIEKKQFDAENML